MKNLNFGFLKNKFFVSGLIAGLLVSAVIAIVIVSVTGSAPDKSKMRGTMGGGWTPAPGEMGMVVLSGEDTKCKEGGKIVGVQFDNDPNQGVVICKPLGDIAPRVKVVNVIQTGQCLRDGIWVTRVNL